MKHLKIVVAVGLAGLGVAAWGDMKTTYRDASGRVQATSTTDRYGKTTYRDYQGRVQGTTTTDRYGKTTYRDASGRVSGAKK